MVDLLKLAGGVAYSQRYVNMRHGQLLRTGRYPAVMIHRSGAMSVFSHPTQIAPNRKEIGVAFKKEAKAVTEYLEGMSECDALELKAKLEAGSGTITVDKQVCDA